MNYSLKNHEKIRKLKIMSNTSKITQIEIDDQHLMRFSPQIRAEYEAAKQDLLATNHITVPDISLPPQLRLHLKSVNNFNIQLTFHDLACTRCYLDLPLKLLPLKSIIKDYFILCESFYHATQHSPIKVEAFDMGRRALHNEGADQLLQQLNKRLSTDHNTARKLFTLICALHLNLRHTI